METMAGIGLLIGLMVKNSFTADAANVAVGIRKHDQGNSWSRSVDNGREFMPPFFIGGMHRMLVWSMCHQNSQMYMWCLYLY